MLSEPFLTFTPESLALNLLFYPKWRMNRGVLRKNATLFISVHNEEFSLTKI